MIDSVLPYQQTPTIEFSGELCIREIGAAHARLTAALQGQAAVVLAIDDQATVDLSFVQLLESARRTADEDGGAVSLAGPATGDLLEVLQRGGFLNTGRGRAFWLNESECA